MCLVSYVHSKCVSHANHASNAYIRNHATCKSVKSQESLEVNVGDISLVCDINQGHEVLKVMEVIYCLHIMQLMQIMYAIQILQDVKAINRISNLVSFKLPHLWNVCVLVMTRGQYYHLTGLCLA